MRRARLRLLLPCILLAITPGLALPARQAAPPAQDAAVRYTLSFPAAHQQWMQIEARFSGVIGPLAVRMSRASPGRYALHEFARHVYDVRAVDGGARALPVAQQNPHEWHVDGHDGIVRFQYRLAGDQLDGTFTAIDATHAHLNMPATLVWARGFEEHPATVTLVPPSRADWRVATQLFAAGDRWTFSAPNLQYLMDSPIEASAFSWRSFEPRPVRGVAGPVPTIAVAIHHEGTEADVDRYTEDVRALVPETAAVFGEYPPFEGGRYTFIADYLPWATGDGMEHRNSTVLTSSTAIARGRQRLIETAAHEFFHAWNMERIRARALEPFDFTDANPSRELWFGEGVTSYYEQLVLHRAGLSSPAELASGLGAWVNEVMTSPAHAFRSAEEMSLLAPLVDAPGTRNTAGLSHTYISYYTFGAAIALGLDLAIRERTGGSRSLDEVMRAMWERHGKPGAARPGYVDAPYTTADIVRAIGDVTGDAPFAEGLVGRFVQGREVMDYARLLSLAGFTLQAAAPDRRMIGGVALGYAGGRLRLASPPPPGSPADGAGLALGDEIVSVDGRPVHTVGDFDEALRAAPGDQVRIRVNRRGHGLTDARVALVRDPAVAITLAEETGARPTAAQLAFRSAWLGPRAR